MHSVEFGRLANGLRIVSIHRPHLHRSVVAAYVEVGSRHETRRNNGLSHFLEHMLFRGTRRYRTAYALNLAIESMGGTLAAATHGDYTRFDLTVPPDSLARACRTLGSMFTSPVFSQIEIEKAIVREEILENLDDDHRECNADNLTRLQVFGDDPLGYPITGTLGNVDRFTERDLRAHLDRYYRAGNMVVAICSPLPHRQAMRAVARGFDTLPAGKPESVGRARVTQRRARIQRMDTAGSQTTVRIAFPTPGEEAPMARSIELLLRVLDDGMSTRLHRRICDELGLAYEVSAGVELFREIGITDVASNVAHGSVPRLASEVLTMLGDLAVEGPTRAEIEKAQHRYAFDLASLNDEPHGLADFYGAAALWNERVDVDARRALVLELTPEALRRAARVVFTPMRLNLTTVGSVEASMREGLGLAVRRYRERMAKHARPALIAVPRPAARVREPFAVIRPRSLRATAALDSYGPSP